MTCDSARSASPSTAMPKKPSTTEGMAEMNSMQGLMNRCSAGVAIWLT
jgi:hypothetical protein